MNDLERLKAAVKSPGSAQVLRDAVMELAAEGREKPEIYSLLEQLLMDVRATGKDSPAEDAVMDVMDALVGWCHPDARLLTEQELLPRDGR
jgi:uncharacterized membrane protein